MPALTQASLKKGSQTVFGVYRGAVSSYNPLTFYRNFAQLKTLNHGTGPAITFTRGTNATYFDASGTLRFAPNNHIRNSEATGATVGVIGSGGVMPMNWIISGQNINGLSAEIVGTGTEDGLSYMDLKISGTPTSSASVGLNTESGTQIVASNGQTWTGSTYIKLQAGANTNAAYRAYLTGRDSGGAVVAGQTTTVVFVPTSATLTSQRITGTRTFSDAAVARVTYNFEVVYTNGNPIDLTLRIAAPQLELGSTATDYNPTTGTAYFGPRFDHDPATGASRGLLIEEARTNSIRNSQAGGGSSSTLPTNWMSYTDVGTIAVVGNGTEAGMNYVDVQFSGTNSSGAPQSGFVSADATNAIAALSGQTWSASWYVKLVAGSLTGAVVGVRAQERKSTTALNPQTQTSFTPTSSYQRISASRTLTGADTAFVTNEMQVGANVGATIDLTLRIAAPQLEQGAFATSYIPTTTATATRAADSAVVTPISSFYNQTEGTIFSESRRVAEGSGGFPAPLRFFQTVNDVQFLQQWVAANGTSAAFKINGGVNGAEVSRSGLTANQAVLICGSYAENNVIAAINGTLTSQDTSVNIPSTIDRLQIGTYGPFAQFLNGHIRKIAYWPRRLSNTLLQQLTT